MEDFDPVDWNGSEYQDYVLQFNPDNGSWSKVGQLQVAREYHEASVVNVVDVITICR